MHETNRTKSRPNGAFKSSEEALYLWAKKLELWQQSTLVREKLVMDLSYKKNQQDLLTLHLQKDWINNAQ